MSNQQLRISIGLRLASKLVENLDAFAEMI